MELDNIYRQRLLIPKLTRNQQIQSGGQNVDCSVLRQAVRVLPTVLAAGSDTIFTGLEDSTPKLSAIKTFRSLRYGRGPMPVLSAARN